MSSDVLVGSEYTYKLLDGTLASPPLDAGEYLTSYAHDSTDSYQSYGTSPNPLFSSYFYSVRYLKFICFSYNIHFFFVI